MERKKLLKANMTAISKQIGIRIDQIIADIMAEEFKLLIGGEAYVNFYAKYELEPLSEVLDKESVSFHVWLDDVPIKGAFKLDLEFYAEFVHDFPCKVIFMAKDYGYSSAYKFLCAIMEHIYIRKQKHLAAINEKHLSQCESAFKSLLRKYLRKKRRRLIDEVFLTVLDAIDKGRTAWNMESWRPIV